MHAFMNRLKKDQTGLTLIELIVVVAIIGVLAWLITPRVLEALGKSKTASMENFGNELMAAMERYAGDPDKGNGSYPPDDNAGAEINQELSDLARVINMNIGKTDGFLDSTDINYESVLAGATYTPKFCAFLQGVEGVDDLWITSAGVFEDPDAADDALNVDAETGAALAADVINCVQTP